MIRWLGLLPLLLVVTAVAGWSRSAAASTRPEPETRLGVFDLASATCLRLAVPSVLDNASGKAPFAYEAASSRRLRWKGRWFEPVAGGLYEMRARWWSPQMGAFLSIDEFAYHDANSTLWGFPGQNPLRWSDPTGHDAAGAALGASLGGSLGGWIGGTLGAAGGGIIAIPTGPGEAVAIPAGAIGGFGAGASFGALVGGSIGDLIRDWINVQAQPNTPDQDAVIQLGKEAKQLGGVTEEEAEILEEWAKEFGVPFRDPESHPGRPVGQFPHIHVGPVGHIPVRCP